MSEQCGVCSRFASVSQEPRCSGPCRKIVHAKCARKAYNVPVDSCGKLMKSFRCSDCVRGKDDLGPNGTKPATGGVGSSNEDLLSIAGDFFAASATPLPSTPEVIEPSNGVVLQAVQKCTNVITEFMTSQRVMNERVSSQLDATSKAIEKLTSSLNDIHLKLGELSSVNVELTSRCDQLQDENLKLREALHKSTMDTSSRLNFLERQVCGEQLLVSGVPERDDEDLPLLMCDIGSVLGVRVAASDVRTATRLGRVPSGGARPRGILVTLTSKTMRNNFIAGKRRKGILLIGEIPLLQWADGKAALLYINESLPPSVRRLHSDAREFVRAHGWRRAWTRDGVIWVTRDSASRPIKILHHQDLEDLLGSM